MSHLLTYSRAKAPANGASPLAGHPMTPQIALDLSLDGIAVLSRAGGGVWWREGVVRLDDPEMPAALTRLRARCAARVGEGFTSILIIPDSQILFTSLERDDRDPKVTIRTLLQGRTPYEVEDLAFDYIQKGDRLQVAVVAIETLMEAEEFAAGFGYQPVALMANPSDSTYPGQAHFGQSGLAKEILGGEKLTLDLGDGFEVIAAPEVPAVPEPEPEPTEAPADAEAKEPEAPETKDEAPAADDATEALPHSPPVPVAPPVATDPAPDAETFEDALAAVEAAPPPDAPRPTPPEPPVVAPAPTAPKTPVPAEPAFSTRRKADGPAPAKPTDEPTLKRITPRLSAPAKGAGAAATASKPSVTPPQDETTEPAAVVPPVAAAGASRLPNLGFKRTKTAKTKTPDTPAAIDPEAVAMTLPGIARAKAAKPPHAGSAKLGLYLTLSLIGLMAIVALWSVLQSPDSDVAKEAGGETALLIPEVAAPPAPAAEDLARLLPTSEATPAEAPATSGPVAPPLPITEGSAPAAVDTPEEAPETLEPAGTFEDSPASPAAPAPGNADTVIASVDPARSDGETDALPPAALPDATPLAPAPATPTPAAPADAAIAAPAEGAEVPEVADTPVSPEEDAPAEVEPQDTADTAVADVTEAAEPAPEALVAASPEGTPAAGGYTVFEGRPDVMPVQRASTAGPTTEGAEPETSPEDEAARAALRRTAPVQRPATIAAEAEAERAAEDDVPQIADGFTREELTRTRPAQRPRSITDAAATAAREAEAAREAAAEQRAAAVDAAAAAAVASLASQATQEAAEQAAPPTSALALAASDRPRGRPRSVERAAARIVTQRREQASAAAASTAQPQATPAPAAPASSQTIRSAGGSVARAATQRNAIRLRDVNLIGVYGRPDARRAIVRLSNGRYVKVEVGDRLDRGRVTAIGDSQLVYQRGGRNVTLRMPNA